MIQVYTGNGKGKTTAALGLALRAAGAGLRVYICQFLKGKECSELISLKRLKNIKVARFGKKCFIKSSPSEEDRRLAKCALEAARKALRVKRYDVIILDEINVAVGLNLLPLADIMRLIKDTPRRIELILTGRNAPSEIISVADLVSEIKEKKHYFKSGLKARKGIEF